MKLASNPQTTKTADFPSSVHISQIRQGVFIISIRKKEKIKARPATCPGGNKKIPKVQSCGCGGSPFHTGKLSLPASLQMPGPESGQGLLGLLEKSRDPNRRDLEAVKAPSEQTLQLGPGFPGTMVSES